MTLDEEALMYHKKWKGKTKTASKVGEINDHTLAVCYTPGVAAPCWEITADPSLSYEYTWRGNSVAVVSDGSAVLGLGNIGPYAAMPVMDGKCVLFKEFAGIDAVPICLDTQDVDEVVAAVKAIAPSFGGINLEDIAAPRCFEIEKRLKEELNIPVFHDDQHGTAIVVLAGIINSLKYTKKDKDNVKIIVNGAGAAGTAITSLLVKYGFNNIVLCDINGVLTEDKKNLDDTRKDLVRKINPEGMEGPLEEAIKGRDIFVGVSAPNILTPADIKAMNDDPIVFAMSNPEPEIMPDVAKKAGACVVGTGRSDFPNQVNNVLAFPGIFRGALDSRAKQITDEMKLSAAKAIASLVSEEDISNGIILPKPFDKRLKDAVAKAVSLHA